MRQPILKACRIVKKYGELPAVDGVSLHLCPGEIVAILGPNGAGKTTLLKCLMGLARVNEGHVEINGQPHSDSAVRQKMAYVPETPILYDLLTVWEHLHFVALAYRLTQWEDRAVHLLDRFHLGGTRNAMVNTLSKGMRQKVSISAALLHEPEIMIFDEPLVGLDPSAQRELKNIIIDLAREGRAVLVSTHMLDTVEQLCHRALILQRGRLVAEGTPAELRSQYRLPADVPLEDVFLEAVLQYGVQLTERDGNT